MPPPLNTVPVFRFSVLLLTNVEVAGMVIVPLLMKLLLLVNVPPAFMFKVPLLVQLMLKLVLPVPLVPPVLLNVPLLVNTLVPPELLMVPLKELLKVSLLVNVALFKVKLPALQAIVP